MNLRQPYEQLIADKLRQLRAPDANASWQQMKQLLDDDEDTKGGGGRRRPPGNNGLWRLGILVIVLTASFWLYVEKTPSPSNSLSKNNKAITPQAENKSSEANKNNSNNQTAAIDNTTTLTSSEANNNTTANNTISSSSNKTNTADNAAVVSKKNTNSAVKSNNARNTYSALVAPLAAERNATNKAIAAVKNGSEKNNTGSKIIIDNKGDHNDTYNPGVNTASILSPVQKNKSDKVLDETNIAKNEIATGWAANRTNDKDYSEAAISTNQPHGRKVKTGAGELKNSNHINDGADGTLANSSDNNKIAGNNFAPVHQASSSKEKTWFEKITGLRMEDPIPSFNTSLATGDSIADIRDVSHLLNKETQKDIAKAKRDKEIAVLDKQDKKFHLNLSNLFKPFSMHIDAEPWWAAGIALNAPITVNAQNRFNNNMNAKSSTLTDYIPSPYLQFHLNNYVYFQTELNFIMPQYTPQLLLYRQSNDISAQLAGSSQEKSIYVQKMYYFNWPVSLHYSPVSNLFFSGGIQFSSFQSGLATIEEKQFPTVLGVDHPSNINSTTLKFKDDSIAAKIAPNEWRWQVGAEYYINRFSVGMRYNQSFKNAINTTVLPGMAPTVSRNQSLLFFVRYNLFDSKQKNSVPKNQ